MKEEREFLSPEDKLKYEIASELGLLEKVSKGGWKSLTAKETGKIGGMITARKKKENKGENTEENGDKSN